ncbi:MAG: alpha/beta fold hydrolase [Acidobacteriota bacterium]
MDPSTLVLTHSLTGRPGAPVILFLHGITGSHRYYARKVQPLRENYQLLLLDLPGFGDSAKPRTDYTIEFYRDTVRNTVEASGCQHRPLHIVAHSLGALIALEYTLKYPDQVDRLVILSLPRFQNARAAHRYFQHGSPNYRRLLNEHSVRKTLSQWRRTGLAMALHYVLHFPMAVIRDSRKFTLNSLTSTLENCLLNYRVDDVLEKLDPRPIRLLHGQGDQVAPVANVRDLPVRYPHMELVEIADSGHHIFLTHTRQCLELIEAHLSRRVRRPEVLRTSEGPVGHPV